MGLNEAQLQARGPTDAFQAFRGLSDLNRPCLIRVPGTQPMIKFAHRVVDPFAVVLTIDYMPFPHVPIGHLTPAHSIIEVWLATPVKMHGKLPKPPEGHGWYRVCDVAGTTRPIVVFTR